MNKDEYTQYLEGTITRVTSERDAAIKRIQQLEAEKEELIKRLRIYENPHTPPSMQIAANKKKAQKEDKQHKKRGAPTGHKGATRKTPEPDEVIDVVADHCEKCGSGNIEKLDDFEKNIREDIPPPMKIRVTQFNRWMVKCLNCGHNFTSKHKDCPQTGNFGIYLLVYITMLKFHLRGVIRKIQEFLLYHSSFEISIMGINNALLRVGDVCKGEYDKVVEKIRNAKWVHMDETGMKVNGEQWWLWIFRTPENDVLVVIRKSRGSNVPQERLGEDFNGVGIVDGWTAYNWIRIIQRCWAHLIRVVDEFKKVSDAGKMLSENIHAEYKELKEFIDRNPSMKERIKKKEEWDKRMEELVEKYSAFNELEKPIKYIRNGLGSWYTCLLYPGMEPTNNLGEQAMREHVIMRKIIGTFRSENGSQNYQYIASMLATWKLQGKNPFVELEGLLRRELCLK